MVAGTEDFEPGATKGFFSVELDWLGMIYSVEDMHFTECTGEISAVIRNRVNCQLLQGKTGMDSTSDEVCKCQHSFSAIVHMHRASAHASVLQAIEV